MSTSSLCLKKEFDIKEIISIHYFEYKSDFLFKSDYYNYWNLLYVEAGTAEISFSKKQKSPQILSTGDLFIQAPDEYYSFRAADGSVPIVFTIGFYCESKHLELLRNRLLHCHSLEAKLLHLLSEEAKNNFSPKIQASSTYSLERKYNQPFGGEQLIGAYLEMLLISLIRQYATVEKHDESLPTDSEGLLKSDSILFNRITDFYASHIADHVTIEQLCEEFSIGRSHLQRIFREQTGFGAIEYFCQMRISTAKQLIRENKMNLTDTAATLGYTSIHYFSKQFKKITGISPSSYQKSIRTASKDPICEHIDLERK